MYGLHHGAAAHNPEHIESPQGIYGHKASGAGLSFGVFIGMFLRNDVLH